MTPAARASLLFAATVVFAGCRQAPPEPAPAPAPEPAPQQAPLEPASGQTAGSLVPRAFLCRGNEPFWALDITSTGAVLKTPDAETPLTGELKATDSGAFGFRGAPDDGAGGQVAALMSPGQCFDTMADGPAMPFVARASFADGMEASGCCTVEYGLDLSLAPVFSPSGKAADDWSRHLPDLAAAIDRCMLDAGVATEVVTVAGPLNGGKAKVRLRDQGMDRFDCIIDLGGNKIESIGQVAAEDRQPFEGKPLLRPAGDPPPILACGRAERVLRGDGSLLGYLHHLDGCD